MKAIIIMSLFLNNHFEPFFSHKKPRFMYLNTSFGITIAKNAFGLYMYKRKYVPDMMTEYGLLGLNHYHRTKSQFY